MEYEFKILKKKEKVLHTRAHFWLSNDPQHQGHLH